MTRLKAGQLRNHGSIPGREKRLFLLYSAQNGTRANTLFYSVSAGYFFPRDKASGA